MDEETAPIIIRLIKDVNKLKRQTEELRDKTNDIEKKQASIEADLRRQRSEISNLRQLQAELQVAMREQNAQLVEVIKEQIAIKERLIKIELEQRIQAASLAEIQLKHQAEEARRARLNHYVTVFHSLRTSLIHIGTYSENFDKLVLFKYLDTTAGVTHLVPADLETLSDRVMASDILSNYAKQYETCIAGLSEQERDDFNNAVKLHISIRNQDSSLRELNARGNIQSYRFDNLTRKKERIENGLDFSAQTRNILRAVAIVALVLGIGLFAFGSLKQYYSLVLVEVCLILSAPVLGLLCHYGNKGLRLSQVSTELMTLQNNILKTKDDIVLAKDTEINSRIELDQITQRHPILLNYLHQLPLKLLQ